jgi:hypothetical protein
MNNILDDIKFKDFIYNIINKYDNGKYSNTKIDIIYKHNNEYRISFVPIPSNLFTYSVSLTYTINDFNQYIAKYNRINRKQKLKCIKY